MNNIRTKRGVYEETIERPDERPEEQPMDPTIFGRILAEEKPTTLSTLCDKSSFYSFCYDEYLRLRTLIDFYGDFDQEWLDLSLVHAIEDYDLLKNEIESGIENDIALSFVESRINALLEIGANPNYKDETGSTPLHKAKDLELVRLLLSYGADPKIKDKNGLTALDFATERQIIETLLKAGADPNGVDVFGIPLVFKVADLSILKLYEKYGANLEVVDSNGNTLLHNNIDDAGITRYLLQKELDPNKKNKEGKSPLYYTRNPNVRKLLVSYGAREGKR
jgi:FOG: Ankyrin repeat